MSIADLPAFAIVIKDHPASEYYFCMMQPLWKDLNVNVQRFDATTPDTLPDGPLIFEPINTLKYKARGYRKEFTPTEKAVWYSHYRLWQKCIEMNQRIFVLEHDANPTKPQYILDDEKFNFISFDAGAMGAYIIDPRGAQLLMRALKKRDYVVKYGPLGHIDVTKYYYKKEFKVISSNPYRTDGAWIACTNHLLSKKYGKTIDHYTGTKAEHDPVVHKKYNEGVFHEVP